MDKKEIKQEETEQKYTRIDVARTMFDDCRYPEALQELEFAQEEEPENYEINYEIARIQFETGDYYSAITNYEIVLEHHKSAIIYYNLGCAYEANDEIDKAIGAHLKATAVNQNFPFPYKKLGMLYMARGDKESAKEYFEDYLKLDIAEDEKESVNKILERIK